MMQMAISGWPRHAATANVVTRLAAAGRRASLPASFRLPKPEEGLSEDIRRILEEDDSSAGQEDYDGRPAKAPEAGWGAGMALCIPSLTLLGILYSLLK